MSTAALCNTYRQEILQGFSTGSTWTMQLPAPGAGAVVTIA